MTLKVAAFYQFASLADYRSLQEPLRALCAGLGLKGSILLAPEGINGTVAGQPDAIDRLVDALRTGPLFGGRLHSLELKFSTAAAMPFGRMKVRLKREIVTLGAPEADPVRVTGTYVEPADWNALLQQPDILLIDTRNAFEVAMGTFPGATDPWLGRFSDFRDFTARDLAPHRDRRVAMFCTGGIRCEKASAYLLAHGFKDVFQLKGGILNYLEATPVAESLWSGECFVFDERVALGHGLVEQAMADNISGGADD